MTNSRYKTSRAPLKCCVFVIAKPKIKRDHVRIFSKFHVIYNMNKSIGKKRSIIL